MKKLLIVFLTVCFIGCTPKELIPAQVLARVMYISDILIELHILNVSNYGHFMSELTVGDQIEVYVYESYMDSLHLMGAEREFSIKREYGYWELVE